MVSILQPKKRKGRLKEMIILITNKTSKSKNKKEEKNKMVKKRKKKNKNKKNKKKNKKKMLMKKKTKTSSSASSASKPSKAIALVPAFLSLHPRRHVSLLESRQPLRLLLLPRLPAHRLGARQPFPAPHARRPRRLGPLRRLGPSRGGFHVSTFRHSSSRR